MSGERHFDAQRAEGRGCNHFAEAFAAAKFFAAAFIDGDRRLTDIAARRIFPMQSLEKRG
jgi:hypothetical protein